MNQTLRSRLRGAFLPGLAALALTATPARADWTRLTLGTIPSAFSSFAGDQLPDGRLVYGTKNAVFEQTAFGLAASVALGTPPNVDPSDLAIYDAQLGVVGAGGPFGTPSSPIYRFDPGTTPPSSTTYTNLPAVALQNYSLVFKDSTSVFVGGTNGTDTGTGKTHSITYVPLVAPGSGPRSVTIVDKIAPFSGGFDIDLAGNLFLVDPSDTAPGDKNIYEFSHDLVASVLAGGPALTLANGTRIAHSNGTGSLAIDALGRIWTAGTNGIEVYDPVLMQSATFTPQGAGYNYRVSTFTTTSGNSYVDYLYADPNQTTPTLIYGYDLVGNVPEPTSGLLLAAGALVCANRRRHVVRP